MSIDSTILVTGNESNLRRTLALVLRSAGFKAFAGEFDFQVPQRQEAHPYDMVILDLSVPDVKGLSLLTRIRQSDPGLPVLVLAGFTSPESIVGIKHTKTLMYLVKPIDPACLIACVRAILREPASPLS